MIKALQQVVVSELRRRRFTGTFPHFRRLADSHTDLLTFQFDRHGGGFVIEVSQCPREGITTYWDEHIPPSRVRAWDMHPDQRYRLQLGALNSTAGWFRYDQDPQIDFEQVAMNVLPYLELAEKWWQEQAK